MVNETTQPVNRTEDYQSQYNDYWSRDDRIGESSSDLEQTADQIVMSCGLGPTLDIGSGEGALVAALLRRGVDAQGVDVSEVVVSRCNQRIPGRFTRGSVLALPFPDGFFQTVVSTDCMEHLAAADVPLALKEIHRVAGRFVFLKLATTQDRDQHWHLTVEGRAWWEARCFEAGFRKHPAYYRLNEYESLNQEGWQIVIPLEKISANALALYPLASLRAERDLHMDMLREHGSRSDAHVARYHFACKYVRPGDVVLDAACGLGYGSYVIRSLTKCSTVTGIDGSAYGVDYATINFSSDHTIQFTQGYLPDCLQHIPDNSVDGVVCFETLEHVEAPDVLLREFHRILTPGGRLITSVPHDWSDETGQDPNPFHLHVYDRSRFVSELAQSFEIEQLVGQTADRIKKPGGACEWVPRPRSFIDLDPLPGDEPVEAEWLLAVVCKSPLNGADVPYVERVFSEDERTASGNALAFARDYENPWLIRSLVSIGLRTESRTLRERWANEIVRRSPADSADYGAALCVLAYLIHEDPVGAKKKELIEAIDAYISIEAPLNPNVLRWQVSLSHVRGLLELVQGQREQAKQFFQRVISFPSETYSVTLLTKPAEAAYLLGLLYLSGGEPDLAESVWRTSFNELLKCIGQHLAAPYPAFPPNFELSEISSAISLIGRFASAAGNARTISLQPSLFRDAVSGHMVGRLGELQKDNGVLLSQWKAAQGELLVKEAHLAEVLKGKDWLESQWKAVQGELLAKEAHLAEVESQLQEQTARLVRLQNVFPVRVLRKIRAILNV
jgi:ubiquinone/menaquinone biosynthesis C-methylase UbiE